MRFSEYLEREGRGTLTRLQYATRISYPTLLKAKRGGSLSPAHAKLLSDATGGEVPAELLESGDSERLASTGTDG